MTTGVADQRHIRQLSWHYPRKDEVVSHVVGALNQFPTLHPEQSDFNYDDGRVELLLSLVGVIPVTLRGTVYNCPLAIWLPLDYPTKPPMVLITPTNTMQIKPGQSVDRNGKVSVPYLADWERKAEGVSLSPLLDILTGIFGRDYPLVSIAPQPPKPAPPPQSSDQRPPSQSQAQKPASPVPPPRPQPPAGHPNTHLRNSSIGSSSGDVAAPARPPFPPGASGNMSSNYGSHHMNGPYPGYAGPPGYSQKVSPSPPLPPPLREMSVGPPRPPPPPNHFSPPPQQHHSNNTGPVYAAQHPFPPSQPSASQFAQVGQSRLNAPSPPPPPPQPALQHPQQYPGQNNHVPSSVQPPYHPVQQFQHQQQQQHRPQSPLRQSVPAPAPPSTQLPYSPAPPPITNHRDSWQQQQFDPRRQQYDASNRAVGDRGPLPPPATDRAKRVAVNILDGPDDLFTSPNPVQSTSAPPPPRPANPELLAIRSRLHAKMTHAMGSLQARTDQEIEQMARWEGDLLKGEPAVLDEMQRLEAVRGVCQVVKDRYRDVVGAGEARLADYEVRGEGPEVDEIVCSSTVVYNQLLELVAEEAALEDTIYHLGRGLNSETANIDLERFLRRTRGLAREQFIKRALINKILVLLAARRAASTTASAA